MSIRDEALAASRKGGFMCRVAKVKLEMSKKDAAELQEALDDITIDGTAIARVLSNRGIKIGVNSIQRHRRGDCSCE